MIAAGAVVLWVSMRQMDAAKAEREMEMRRRGHPARHRVCRSTRSIIRNSSACAPSRACASRPASRNKSFDRKALSRFRAQIAP